MQGHLRILCFADVVESTNQKVRRLFTKQGINCINEKAAPYWKNTFFMELQYSFETEALDLKAFQKELAFICAAESTEVRVSNEDIELGWFNSEAAMEKNHSLLFAACYIKK